MASFPDSITQMLKSSSFQYELKKIQSWASDELYKAVQTFVYDAYSPIEYERTFNLINSITTIDLIVTSSSIEFKVIFDPNKLEHETYGGSKKYGLSAHDEIGGLLIPWLNEGFQHDGYQGGYDMFHARPGAHFLEEAIAKIKTDVVGMVKNSIGVEVRKIGGRYS